MSKLRVARIVQDFRMNSNNNIEFNNNANTNNNINENNIKGSLLLLEDINNSINKTLSQSVLDLVSCFICLGPAEDPLTCPKCNNFGCKKCLELYFKNSNIKPCPLCKQDINLKEMNENLIIKNIETILNKNNNKADKVKELSDLILKKKNGFEGESKNISSILDRIFKYQETVKKYREEYNFFLAQMQQTIEKVFDEYNKKIEELINSLLSYNQINDSSIKKYNDIYNNSINNHYNNDNIKDLINEILSLERKNFNINNHNETENFLNTSIRIIPIISRFIIKEVDLYRTKINQTGKKKITGNYFKIGDYILIYDFQSSQGCNCSCKLIFTLNNDNKKMCFLISQMLIFENNKERLFPMKLVKQNGKTYTYECQIICEEIKNIKDYFIKFRTEALVSTI